MIKEIAVKIMNSGYVCDHCLGRQFSRLLSGFSNEERGRVIRNLIAMEHDIKPLGIDMSNLYGAGLRRKAKSKKPGKCAICEDIFLELEKFADKASGRLKKTDYESFLVGVKMSDSLVMKEEALWEKAGILYCEPIKSEISRELGKAIEEKTGKSPNLEKPDVIILLEIPKKKIDLFANPVFVYGEYRKLVRGLPQTSSPRYKQTVQDIIAKPIVSKTKGFSHVLHALGREDKEAMCLAWRPFVLEIKEPMKKPRDLRKIQAEINRSKNVKVRKLRVSDKKGLIDLKSEKPDKVYSMTVEFEKPVEKPERIEKLVGKISQRTPRKVLGSKPEKIKNKKVKSIKWKRINNKKYRIKIKTESGLYIKELVTGDSGRTRPSVSSILGNRGKVIEFDLIGLER